MKRIFLFMFVAVLALSWLFDGKALNRNEVPAVETTEASLMQESQRGKTWDAFEMADLIAKREQSNRPYLPFLKVPTLNTGLYVLGAGAKDNQPSHKEDEVYYVVSGKGILKIGDEDHPVKPGSVIYVKADIEHRFHSITEELKVLVFFSSAPTSK